jgi:hypothetical protein
LKEYGTGPQVDFLIAQGATLTSEEKSALLQWALKKYGTGPRVDFLIAQGATLTSEEWGEELLLALKYRANNPMVQFILKQDPYLPETEWAQLKTDPAYSNDIGFQALVDKAIEQSRLLDDIDLKEQFRAFTLKK